MSSTGHNWAYDDDEIRNKAVENGIRLHELYTLEGYVLNIVIFSEKDTVQ